LRHDGLQLATRRDEVWTTSRIEAFSSSRWFGYRVVDLAIDDDGGLHAVYAQPEAGGFRYARWGP
jgi:hypothetical protein